MNHTKHIDQVLESIGDRLSRIECTGASDSTLGYRYVPSDGKNEREKWLYINWDELVSDFQCLHPPVKGSTKVTVTSPGTKKTETRYVSRHFIDWVENYYQVKVVKFDKAADNLSVRRPWLFSNWEKLVTDFQTLYPPAEVFGEIKTLLVEPFTSEHEIKYLTPEFIQWASDKFEECSAKRIRKYDPIPNDKDEATWTTNRGERIKRRIRDGRHHR
jgi:hypothetical protein